MAFVFAASLIYFGKFLFKINPDWVLMIEMPRRKGGDNRAEFIFGQQAINEFLST